MPDLTETYDKLTAELRRLDRLHSISGLLGWDEQVNLPAGSAVLRSEQNAAYSELLHREGTSAELGRMLDALEADADALDFERRRVVEVARRDYDQAVKLPGEFVSRKARNDSLAYHAWAKARESGEFAPFAPMLKGQIDTAIEQAGILGHGDAPYDYWIDQFDPGTNLAAVESLFGPLEAELAPLAQRLADAAAAFKPAELRGFDIAGQQAMLNDVLRHMGFDFGHGRVDTAPHPFCDGGGQDTRITTRYDEDNPLDSLFSAMHECGHALYEQGLPDARAGTALGLAAGMAVHESQSRIWENQVGRSRSFWAFWEERFRKRFPTQLQSVSGEDLYRTINHVKPGPVRLDADEVTYNLHIILRFNLEKDLLSGRLSPAELPQAWRAQSKALLGVEPGNEREGCMQDVHWACGLFGYFPSYTLGNLLAAQLWERVNAETPDLDQAFSSGNFRPLLDWLRKNVHAYARRYTTDGLALRVSGSKLSHKAFISYINGRYLPLHHF
ncbi:MAG: carboxypeptidase M32 [Opitutales bacterium]|jgi:carboxypeptidase Taq